MAEASVHVNPSVGECRQFQGICGCKENTITLAEANKLSEHFLALVLRGMIRRNMYMSHGSVNVVYDINIGAGPSTLGGVDDLRLRCDGVLSVGPRYGGAAAEYNHACMSAIPMIMRIWKAGNKGSRDLDVVANVLEDLFRKGRMADADILLDIYAQATK